MRASLISLLAALRLYAPLIVLLALTVLVTRSPGAGVGFVAGTVVALALAAHVLVFGAAESRRAFPPLAARRVSAFGMIAAIAGAAMDGALYAAQISEAGLFALTVAGVHLVFLVLVGRAPTLREVEPS